ncbi:NAD-dependent deacylase [Bdellovibrio sp. 22V]|uniref:NAD-dependent deacylase n=1 Tax=Bdellovibrio sp. 22V TaxID=3044166 RepID=UPI0025429635|nr:NAD-dependent deacylase [Bdellovibrio sp. 22V]WII72165.1 NAD-dependent deacylase [Bdellovibrio sp. 22V]
MSKNIVILTGSGVSAESGIRTFRDQNGLWEDYKIEDVASPKGFAKDPELVHRFYNLRRRQLKDPSVQPNAAHIALARLEREWPGPFQIITQNVDDLHERAGSKKVLHMHGQLDRVICKSCNERMYWINDLSSKDACKFCGRCGFLRPDVIWFGETPYFLELIQQLVRDADAFVSVGTSGIVYPAAGLVKLAHDAFKIEVNTQKTNVSKSFDKRYVGPATQEVPNMVEYLLRNLGARC